MNFFYMTQRTFFFFFLKITQRIDFFQKYDSKNWTSFWVWLKESNSLFFEYDSMNRSHFFECDSIEIWVEKKSQKIELFWLKIELFFTWLEELNFFLFLNLDSKNWTFYYLTRRIELFSYLTQCIELFPVFRKEFIESHWKTRKVQFFESYQRKKSWIRVVLENFNSSSRIQKKKFNFEKVIFKKKKDQFCDSYWKKSSMIRIRTSKKNSILRVIVKKGSILRVIFWKIFWKEGSSLWAIKSQILWVFFFVKKTKSLSHVIQKGWILRVILEKIFESYWKKVQFFVSYFWWKLNSLSRFFLTKNSKIQFFDSCSRNFNSLSHFFEKILRVMLKKVQFFESHKKKSSILWVFFFRKEFHFFGKNVKTSQKKWVRFFESYSKKRKVLFFLSRSKKKPLLWVTFKEGSILWVRFFKKKTNSNWEEVHKRGSILWVVYKEFNSLSHFSKKISIFWVSFLDAKFNSLNHISEKRRGSIL